MTKAFAVALLAVALALSGVERAAGTRGIELTISVAISMKEAVEELGRRFAPSRPGVVLRYNFGASGELQKQIEAGAPIDVFVSAAERQMDALERRGLIVPDTRRVFAENALVAVVPADATFVIATPADLVHPRVGRVVIGNPKTVPAGQYAEESLTALGLWAQLGPRLVFAENVRQALEYVARAEVDAGIVYATDAALRRDRVKEAFRLSESTHRPIRYPVAVVKDTRHPDPSDAFVRFIAGPAARPVLERLGFRVPRGGS